MAGQLEVKDLLNWVRERLMYSCFVCYFVAGVYTTSWKGCTHAKLGNGPMIWESTTLVGYPSQIQLTIVWRNTIPTNSILREICIRCTIHLSTWSDQPLVCLISVFHFTKFKQSEDKGPISNWSWIRWPPPQMGHIGKNPPNRQSLV